MQTAQIIPFQYEAREIRTMLIDDQPWFVAMDVCASLSLRDTNKALVGLDDDEKREHEQYSGSGRKPILINESGLYSLILRSRKAEAKRFKKWITAEVLPAIRRAGRYEDTENKMATLLGHTIGTDGFHCLGAVLDGKVRHLPIKNRQRAKMHVWSQVHKAFSVVSAQDIPASQLDSARNFIAAYVIDGEFLGKEIEVTKHALDDREFYKFYFALQNFACVKEVYKSSNLYEHLKGLGSRIGIDMHDNMIDGGSMANSLLSKYAAEFDDIQRRLRLNQYAIH